MKTISKKAISIFGAIAIFFCLIPTTFAAETSDPVITPAAETINYYTVRNVVLKNQQQKITKELTYWAFAPYWDYQASYGTTVTGSLSVKATSGTISKAAVEATGQFTKSVSTTFQAGTRLAADKTRESILAHVQVENAYTHDYYFITEYQSGQVAETKVGSGYIYEPVRMRVVVIHLNEYSGYVS